MATEQQDLIGLNDVGAPNAFFKVLRLDQESEDIEEHIHVILPNEYIEPEMPLEAFRVLCRR